MDENVSSTVDGAPTMKKLVIESRVKEHVHQRERAIGNDGMAELHAAVEKMLDKALERAEANGRKTIKACDL